MHCIICGEELIQHGPGPKKTKYCSGNCKARAHRGNHYENQKKRGQIRKRKLIEQKGGKCEHCGYCENVSVLEFHHLYPDKKRFHLDLRNCSNRSWDSLQTESELCQLLCANCHRSLHNPDTLL